MTRRKDKLQTLPIVCLPTLARGHTRPQIACQLPAAGFLVALVRIVVHPIKPFRFSPNKRLQLIISLSFFTFLSTITSSSPTGPLVLLRSTALTVYAVTRITHHCPQY